jgi:hypothetical protein
MRGRRVLGGTVLAAMAMFGAQASAVSEAPRQTYSETFTTDVPGAATGRTYAIDYLNPDDPDGKAHAFSHLHLELAAGARFDTSALPHCQASDAELIARGPDACPAETRVGSDETIVDTGFDGPGRHMTADFAFFNNRDELILLPTVRENGARVVVRARIGANTLDIENPMIPGTPPDGGAAKSQRGRFEPRSTVRDGRQANYLTTPPTCPASGHWVNRITWTYRDGVEQTAESRSPCRRQEPEGTDDRAPAIGSFGIPSRCAARRFRVHFRVEDDSRLRSAVVRVDGRMVAVSRHKRLSARIAVADLSAGRHTIAVTATDSAGNRGEGTFRFRVCGG